MESIDSIDWQPSSLPALKIEQPAGSDQLLIRIITPTRSTDLTSKLFEVLDEESLDILHSHKSSNQEKLLHSIRVKVINLTADLFLLLPVILILCKPFSYFRQIVNQFRIIYGQLRSILLGNCSLEFFFIFYLSLLALI